MNRHLKLTQRNYVGYTGQIGRWAFVDGVSVEAIPPIERIRIAANFQVVELDDEGNDLGNPSPAHSVMVNYRARLSLRESLPRQTEDEKQDENIRAVLGAEERKTLLSREALDEVASRAGIAGLREIAVNWNVRSKSIPVLMQMILDAQDDYIARQRQVLTKRGVPADEIEALLKPANHAPKSAPKPVVEEPKIVSAVVTPEQQKQVNALDAARTGDMAAAISIVEAERPE